MHYAVVNGQKVTAELLIANGANVNAKDKNGWTPLDWSITFNLGAAERYDGGKNTPTADLLRKHGGKTGEELKAEGN